MIQKNGDLYKTPRLYVKATLTSNEAVALDEGQTHYLRNVLRREPGAPVRLFNGADGEWAATLEHVAKKNCIARADFQIRKQDGTGSQLHLLFAPIAKDRLAWLLEKAVELGVTDLWPVFTQNTEHRKFNTERANSQIVEASEQCERLDIARLHEPAELRTMLRSWDIPLLAAIERSDAMPVADAYSPGPLALLIGPAGGFTDEEKSLLTATPIVRAVSLGPNILRAETAALAAVSILQSLKGNGLKRDELPDQQS